MDRQGSRSCSAPSRRSCAPQVGDAEKFPLVLGFESLDPFFFFQSQDGGDKSLVQLELA